MIEAEKVALPLALAPLTGGRKLAREGSGVIATTRVPCSAANRVRASPLTASAPIIGVRPLRDKLAFHAADVVRGAASARRQEPTPPSASSRAMAPTARRAAALAGAEGARFGSAFRPAVPGGGSLTSVTRAKLQGPPARRASAVAGSSCAVVRANAGRATLRAAASS